MTNSLLRRDKKFVQIIGKRMVNTPPAPVLLVASTLPSGAEKIALEIARLSPLRPCAEIHAETKR